MSFLNHDDDAISIAPELHKVVFEDDKVRILEVSVPVSGSAELHWHPRNINYVQTAGTLRFTKSDGTSADVSLSQGQVTSSGELAHMVENIGDSEVRTVQIEFKA